MHLHIAGTRGSVAVTDPDHAVFGGDTTCLLITGTGGEQVLVDCGSGLPRLAPRLAPDPASAADVLVLLTHFHLDHLMGLPGFPLLYRAGTRLQIAAAAASEGGGTVASVLRTLLGAPLWPVDLAQLPAHVDCQDLAAASGDRPLRRGGLEIRWAPLPHPGGCTAFRVDEPATGASLVIATDAEWDHAPPAMLADFTHLCRHPAPCDLLLCDGQYDGQTIAARRGWGHTSWSRAVALAREVGAARLLLTHHDPEDDDATLLAREQALQAELPSAALARQGMVVDLGGGGQG